MDEKVLNGIPLDYGGGDRSRIWKSSTALNVYDMTLHQAFQ